jgi:hypothetical protein
VSKHIPTPAPARSNPYGLTPAGGSGGEDIRVVAAELLQLFEDSHVSLNIPLLLSLYTSVKRDLH